jgi:hypothetical protein
MLELQLRCHWQISSDDIFRFILDFPPLASAPVVQALSEVLFFLSFYLFTS